MNTEPAAGCRPFNDAAIDQYVAPADALARLTFKVSETLLEFIVSIGCAASKADHRRCTERS